MAARTKTPQHLVLDAATVFWTASGEGFASGEVASCSKSGCNSGPTVFSSTESLPQHLDVGPDDVYWTNFQATEELLPFSGSVAKCAKTGCNSSPTYVATKQPQPFQVAVLGSTLFWTSNHQDSGAVRRCSPITADCAVTQAGVAYQPSGLAATTDWLYWAQSTGKISNCKHTVSEAEGGCGASTSPSGLTTANSLSGLRRNP